MAHTQMKNILITEDFLKFEHTDGLNYVNFGLRHSDKIIPFGKIRIRLKEGLGIGALVPKTNTTLLGNNRYDEFHLSGYGVSLMGGLNIRFLISFLSNPNSREGL